jgi:hypothetical protein
MKQLTIFVNRDLEPRVVAALDHADCEGFLRVGDASGNRFLPSDEVPRTVAWEAVMLVVPAVDDERLRRIVAELAEVADDCDTGPCLRIVATPAETVR